MMEDRHSFSDPRPVSAAGTEPEWEVDVFRDDNPSPILTLKINNHTLPPRLGTGKKKKVAWKLPDSIEITPKFGSVEKQRLLELFKEQKKLRRKATKRGSSTSIPLVKDPNPAEESPPSRPSEGSHAKSKLKSSVKAKVSEEKESIQLRHAHSSQQPLSQKPLRPSVAVTEPSNSDRGPSPPADNAPASSDSLSDTASSSSSTSPSGPTSPPPGFDSFVSLSAQSVSASHYYTVPLESINKPVDLAKTFMESYYPAIREGRCEEVLLHFSNGAQKSLSVGGAHAFCNTPGDMLVQLNSLQGSAWDVRGVVAQPGLMGSVVLLVTGSVMPTKAASPLTFCHTVTLIQVNSAYQIHNDALALLADAT